MIINKKHSLHPRNLHQGRYNFKELISACPELKKYVKDDTINFADPNAVKLLNKAILDFFYGVKYWDIPPLHLCPPIPGRADYIHYAADLLSKNNHGIIPRGKNISVLDIGIGANCVYPLIGAHQYGWSFIGTDIDSKSLASVKKILDSNPFHANLIQTRLQPIPSNIFTNIIQPNEKFDLTICNPPFHTSKEEANAGTNRKITNLGLDKKSKTLLNFGGKSNELWCPGGEAGFIKTMIEESIYFSKNCLWFSSLVSKKENLSTIYGELKRANVAEVETFEMGQGQKISRFVAWSFQSNIEQTKWRNEKWI